MPLSAADLGRIKDELNLNPLGLDYLPHTAEHAAQNADRLNLVRQTLLSDRYTVPASELKIDRDEFNAATPADREYIALVTREGYISPLNNPTAAQGLLSIFNGQNSVTRAALLAVFQEPTSRADQLHRAGVLSVDTVTPSDVADSLTV